jgi:hypothetical protein
MPVWLDNLQHDPMFGPAIAIALLGFGGTLLVVIYSQYKRHGFRFRTRSLLIATTLVAIALGLIVYASS